MTIIELWEVLKLNQAAFMLPNELLFSNLGIVAIVVLASISEAIGQSVVLFVNRVKKHRFIAALLSSSVIYFINYFFLVISISFILRVFLGIEISKKYSIFFIVALAYIPRLFGFLVFSPMIGSVINILLRIWGMLILHMSLVVILGLANHEAIYIVLLSFLVSLIIRHSFGYPLIAWARALTKRVSATDLDLDPNKLTKELDAELHEIKRKQSKK